MREVDHCYLFVWDKANRSISRVPSPARQHRLCDMSMFLDTLT